MTEALENEGEISLADLLQFLADSWRTIVATALVSTVAGLGLAFALPERFAANALLEPAKVLGNFIEAPSVLAEKMRSPTYYSEATLAACETADRRNPRQHLVDELKPNVARQSAFVAVSIRLSSPERAKQCLMAVVEDVKKDQSYLVSQQITVARERLRREEEKLVVAERFMNSISARSLEEAKRTAGADVAGSTLVFVAMQAKQIEISGLKASIDQLTTGLAEPQTKLAALATPIYAPAEKVEPKRALILAIAALGGLMLGVMMAVARRAYRSMRSRSA